MGECQMSQKGARDLFLPRVWWCPPNLCVIPCLTRNPPVLWIPAFAGMTWVVLLSSVFRDAALEVEHKGSGSIPLPPRDGRVTLRGKGFSP
jgi:hypothetical protein